MAKAEGPAVSAKVCILVADGDIPAGTLGVVVGRSLNGMARVRFGAGETARELFIPDEWLAVVTFGAKWCK